MAEASQSTFNPTTSGCETSDPLLQTNDLLSQEQLRRFLDDDFHLQLQRHFLMKGKGRRPDLPPVPTVTNGLLLHLYYMRLETTSTYKELKAWLQKLVPGTSTLSESRLSKRIQLILDSCSTMVEDEVHQFLSNCYDFNALPPVLTLLGMTGNHIQGENYDRASSHEITNEVVVELSYLMARHKKPKSFIVQWMRKLCLSCKNLSDSQLNTKCSNVLKKHIQLKKNKSGTNLSDFLNCQFMVAVEENNTYIKSVHCKACLDKDNSIKENESLIKKLKLDIYKFNEEIEIKAKIIDELQVEKAEMTLDIQDMKPKVAIVSDLKKKIKLLERTVDEMKDSNSSKLFYKRNMDMKITIENLEGQVNNLTQTNLKLEESQKEMLKKVKMEQDLKNKYKKEKAAKTEENQNMLYALNDIKEEDTLYLKQKEYKSTMYADNIRQLYMALQGEANVAGTQASKAVALVSKYLFNKNISLKNLPCPKTCLNFMNEANHIAKQQIVSKIMESKHFTYATDGTSRQKKHFLEHHVVLDSGFTLSVGYSEILDDKADTLLEKSIDLFDELADIYCQANDDHDKADVFKEIITKMASLMSDRASNMKAFNRKMEEFKKSVAGHDTDIHFLYCNAHFLIGLAEETDKAVRGKENDLIMVINRKLGRDNHPIFSTFHSDETCTSRLIRTCADVLGPRGDEKNGCREEWLAHCDSTETKSTFTSHRSNRFNNTFENPVALLYHHKEALYFLTHRVTNSNRKLLSVIYDLEDKYLISIIAAIALLAVHLTTPYWKLMNSKTPYGQFPNHVQTMKAALERWSSEDFDIYKLHDEVPLFGSAFQVSTDIPTNFIQSDACDKDVTTSSFKLIAKRCLAVLSRQLLDFLPGGVYGDKLSDELQNFLDTCPLTNLTGERMFGDLDYDMSRRRTAETHLRSSLNMSKHNGLSSHLDRMTPAMRKKSMSSARKHSKSLKRKHSEAVKVIRQQKKLKIDENERQRKEKQIVDKEKEVALLTEIVSQGGLCTTKEDLRNLMNQPQALQNLKIQIRYRKYYKGAKGLRLTGNRQTLLNSLCNHLGVEYDSDGEEDSDDEDSELSDYSE